MAAVDQEPLSTTQNSEAVLESGENLYDYLASRGITLPLQGTDRSTAQSVRARALALPATTDPQQRRKDVIATMVALARDYACRRYEPATCAPMNKWDYDPEQEKLDPTKNPKQEGLAYVFGGRTPNVRTPSADGSPYLLHGMDCSGLIQLLADAVGIQLKYPNPEKTGSHQQSNPANWTLPADWGLSIREVTDGQPTEGDIAFWDTGNNKGHIGIFERKAGGALSVISATGAQGEFEKNRVPKRGPRSLTVSGLKLGSPTKILRIDGPRTVTVNVKASWKQPYFDYDVYVGPVTSVPLTSLGVKEGAVLQLKALGSYYYTIRQPATANGAAGLFVNGSGSAVPPGANTTASAANLPANCSAGPDPFVGDFNIPDNAAVQVTVPSQATALQLSVDDCVMGDNIPLQDAPRVEITVLSAGGT